MKEQMGFNAMISGVEQVNPLFSKCKIRVMTYGENENRSFISKEAVEKAIPTIFNIPIVGEYKRVTDNYGGHGGKMEITEDGDFKYVHTTKPIGVVAMDANPRWETILDKQGNPKEYLVVDGYLWNRYEEEVNAIKQDDFGQSMEIEVKSGIQRKMNGINIYDIQEFIFSGLCVLGINKDGFGHVEPCFADANISVYELNKEDFRLQFSKLVEELKETVNFSSLKEVNQEVEEVKQETIETTEVTEVTEVVEEQVETVVEEVAIEETATEEVVAEEVTEEQVAFEVEPVVEGEEETVEVVEETPEEEVTEEESVKEVTTETPEEVEETINYQTEFERVQSENQSMTQELEELRSFRNQVLRERHEAAVAELLSGEAFSALEEEDTQDILSNVHDFTLEAIEGKLYERLGKRLAQYSAIKPTKTEKKIVSLAFSKEERVEAVPYGGYFEKFKK
ncbi:hypothetical protein GH892_02795 [Bacillus thuringiensis]|uniref:hypothetical protein n=1 Tax=Bacillus toyonensis TaxID=155322 RepID=UPI001298DF53|nr:hypothetical protein [Bacillus thuringiensis]